MATKPRTKKSPIEATKEAKPAEAAAKPKTTPTKTPKAPKAVKATAAKTRTTPVKTAKAGTVKARTAKAQAAEQNEQAVQAEQAETRPARARKSTAKATAAVESLPAAQPQPAAPVEAAPILEAVETVAPAETPKPTRTKPAGLAAPKRSKKAPAASKPPAKPASKSAPADTAERLQKILANTAERLQKILAKTGVASRRKGEAMILAGRVQVNGAIVTELGSRADLTRDHIRVDGKLLHSTERIRYFVLNKPKGYVTTVSDPEGRPTVMQFFDREPERLYPVGRLDYLSEGLLLVTNDGELANKLTRAASGVEKVYLVKVAGQPTEEMLEALRSGVVIERGRPGTGSGRVRTAPARIRPVRQGDNPWYEVVLIEGRNRELRKMFEEIGHHVEKIRRVGYGPLILDQEPGKMRELDPEELRLLRLAADGKYKPKKNRMPPIALLPREAGRSVRHPAVPPASKAIHPPTADLPANAAPRFPAPRTSDKSAPEARSFSRPSFNKPAFSKPAFSKPGFSKPGSPTGDRRSPARDNSTSRPAPRFASRPAADASRPAKFSAPARRPSTQPPVTDYVLPPRKNRPEQDFEPESHNPAPLNPAAQNPDRASKNLRLKIEQVEDRPRASARPGNPRTSSERPRSNARPPFDRTDRGNRPQPTRNSTPARVHSNPEDAGSQQPRPIRAYPGGPRLDRPQTDRPQTARPQSGRPQTGAPRPYRPHTDRPSAKPFSKPFAAKPDRLDRPDRFDRQNQSSSRNQDSSPQSQRPGPFRGRPAASGKPFARPAGRPFARQSDAPKPQPGGSNSVPRVRLDQDGQPRTKVRARNSFTGKNKGRPKPKR